MKLPLTIPLITLVAALNFATGVSAKTSKTYVQTNLVSDQASLNPVLVDSALVNPWGIAFIPGGPFWINDNGTGLSTLYSGTAVKIPLTVTIPPPSNAPGETAAPTGIVWNGNPLVFQISGNQLTQSALFIFATEDGTISAWNGNSGTTAQLVKDETDPDHGAVYKGLALGVSSAKGLLLYATNFRSGKVDVFDGNFAPVALSTPGGLGGGFSDPNLPAGFAPFGIANVQNDLFVTFAFQSADKKDDVGGAGRGFVDIFDTDGKLVRRFASKGKLNSPWGITSASYNFGRFSSDVLIGNFGDGRINAFDNGGQFLGQVQGSDRKPITIDGLWALSFGGAAQSNPDALYFTAGSNHEQHGLFGSLTPSN